MTEATDQTATLQKGRVKWFHDGRGYGFIERAGQKDLFVHFKDIVVSNPRDFRTLAEGALVSFYEEASPKGGLARNVVVAQE